MRLAFRMDEPIERKKKTMSMKRSSTLVGVSKLVDIFSFRIYHRREVKGPDWILKSIEANGGNPTKQQVASESEKKKK